MKLSLNGSLLDLGYLKKLYQMNHGRHLNHPNQYNVWKSRHHSSTIKSARFQYLPKRKYFWRRRHYLHVYFLWFFYTHCLLQLWDRASCRFSSLTDSHSNGWLTGAQISITCYNFVLGTESHDERPETIITNSPWYGNAIDQSQSRP